MRRKVTEIAGIFAVLLPLLGLSVGAGGCGTQRQELARGRSAFDQNQHERALALFRDLEPDYVRLSPKERIEYAYLRGMTDYRVGYHAEARHWLGVATALDKQNHDVLPEEWRGRMKAALDELNLKAFAGGAGTLSNDVRMNESKAKKQVVEEP